MATKIRLQRFGKKGQPFYHIVIADGRAPRDGKFIEKIGTYNPLTIPATIDIDVDKALSWLQKGASPTDTAKAILSYKGVLYKNHLVKGIAKGALTQEAADAKFEQWQTEKQAKIDSKINQRLQDSKSSWKKKLDAEAKINEERLQAIAAKQAKARMEEEAEEVSDEVASEQPTEEVTEETAEALVEQPVDESNEEIVAETEQPVEEVAEEKVVAETDQPTEEVKEETEEAKTEAPADEAEKTEPEA